MKAYAENGKDYNDSSKWKTRSLLNRISEFSHFNAFSFHVSVYYNVGTYLHLC